MSLDRSNSPDRSLSLLIFLIKLTDWVLSSWLKSRHTLSCGCPSFKWIPLPKSKRFAERFLLLFAHLAADAWKHALGISFTFVWTQMPVFGNKTLDNGSTCIKISAIVFLYTLSNRLLHSSSIHTCSIFILL